MTAVFIKPWPTYGKNDVQILQPGDKVPYIGIDKGNGRKSFTISNSHNKNALYLKLDGGLTGGGTFCYVQPGTTLQFEIGEQVSVYAPKVSEGSDGTAVLYTVLEQFYKP